ncbi:MAG: hypothetical protein LBQ44_02565 [Treponema sp.]|jgi:hypothetical protein|nr:hypothetical protein [Treponema sp.]
MSGRGDNRGRRRPGRHGQEKIDARRPKGDPWNASRGDTRRNAGIPREKSRWVPPVYNTDPLPCPDCACCGKPIKDIHSAVTDKHSGEPIHFDCALAKVSETETLEQGDVISYIGGGRFGIVRFADPQNPGKNFTIKKILEWENTEQRADWRTIIADHFSVT